jgi:tetratricopeptide (TPR) repeat protein
MSAVLLLASPALAQEWKGDGRLTGKVVDEQGKPIQNVRVLATHPLAFGVVEGKRTDKQGEWAIEDVAPGEWSVKFEAEGFEPGQGRIEVEEDGRARPLKTALKRLFDPNAYIKAEVAKADALLNQKKYDEARAVYEALGVKIPDISAQLEQYMARTYYLQGNLDKAIEHLKKARAREPDNVAYKVVLAGVYIEKGAVEEAKQAMAGVDDEKLDPELLVNIGIYALKAAKHEEAVQYFDRGIKRSPTTPQPYYYRALALVELSRAKGQEAQQAERINQAKADLSKFLQLAPSAPEAESVKQLLDQLTKK